MLRRSRCATPCTVCSLQHTHLQVGDDANIPLYCRQDQVSVAFTSLPCFAVDVCMTPTQLVSGMVRKARVTKKEVTQTRLEGTHLRMYLTPRSIDLHTPPRLHGAIATRLQAIITGSGVDFGPQARCPTMLFELRDTDTQLECCVDTSQASVTYRSEFTLRDAVMVGGRAGQAH